MDTKAAESGAVEAVDVADVAEAVKTATGVEAEAVRGG